MNLRAKLDRLERTLRPSGCPVCRGQGGCRVVIQLGDEVPDVACPRCGAVAECVRRIIISPAGMTAEQIQVLRFLAAGPGRVAA